MIADRIASWFVPTIIVVAVLIFGLWLVLCYATTLIDTHGVSGAVYALRFGIALLVVSCPCAVALSVPPVVVVSAGVAARHGLLVKNGRVFEQLARLTDLVLDKTGTLTQGKPRVVASATIESSSTKKSKKSTKKSKTDSIRVRLLDEGQQLLADGGDDDLQARRLLSVNIFDLMDLICF